MSAFHCNTANSLLMPFARIAECGSDWKNCCPACGTTVQVAKPYCDSALRVSLRAYPQRLEWSEVSNVGIKVGIRCCEVVVTTVRATAINMSDKFSSQHAVNASAGYDASKLKGKSVIVTGGQYDKAE